MSDDLQHRIEQTIAEYLADNGGGMVTSWHFVADLMDSDGDTAWLWETAPDQRMITTMGLLAWAQGMVDYEQRAYLNELGDNDCG